jgi:hypothetical protein
MCGATLRRSMTNHKNSTQRCANIFTNENQVQRLHLLFTQSAVFIDLKGLSSNNTMVLHLGSRSPVFSIKKAFNCALYVVRAQL